MLALINVNTGTATNITSSVDMTKFDMEAYATLKLIQDAHMHGSGTNVPIAPEEIAQTIIFLASDRANKISGAMVPIDVAWSVV
jgi:NAD(P)-dependent dehydrogenase (short-subunit alcohol dehydrogenase family)